MGVRFTKWHGLGNDFVVLDRRAGGGPPDAAWARAACDRHTGIGADGVLTLLPAEGADVRMHVTNPDGSVAETCGNGLRIVARALFDAGAPSPLRIEDGGGVRVAEDAGGGEVRVDMGAGRILDADGDGVRVSFGNPHLVFFGGGKAEARSQGPSHPDVNVEFVEADGEGLTVWVWERGAGLTLACGSGACAAALAAAGRGLFPEGREAPVRLPGGTLHVQIDVRAGTARMRGPAVRVFDGEI